VGAHLGLWRFILAHFPSLPSFLLARNLASPCFGHEPKARVATKNDDNEKEKELGCTPWLTALQG